MSGGPIAMPLAGVRRDQEHACRIETPAGLRHDRRAITSWEYALIAALVAIAIVSSLTQLGTATLRPFSLISSDIQAANSGR